MDRLEISMAFVAAIVLVFLTAGLTNVATSNSIIEDCKAFGHSRLNNTVAIACEVKPKP